MNLVIGATGFVGSHVLYQLLKLNQPVKAMIRNPDKIEHVKKIFGYYDDDPSGLISKVEWIRGDISDYHAVVDCIQGVSMVYHTAGLVSFLPGSKKLLNQANHTGTANVVNACLEYNVEKLCYVSSIATLGKTGNGKLIDERVLWKPGSSASRYAVSKYKGEMEVWRGIGEGLQAVIVNPSLIIGPGMWWTTAAPLFTRVYRGLYFYPDGSAGYVDVRDVARIMIKLTETDISGERFILSSENLTHRNFINLVADAMKKKKPKFRIHPAIGKMVCLAERIRSLATGQVPRISSETLKVANDQTAYSNKKIIDTLGNAFIPVSDSVEYAVGIFIKEQC